MYVTIVVDNNLSYNMQDMQLGEQLLLCLSETCLHALIYYFYRQRFGDCVRKVLFIGTEDYALVHVHVHVSCIQRLTTTQSIKLNV